MKRFKIIISLIMIMILASGCVYYNTFYHARKAFNDAESKRQQNKRGQLGAAGSSYKKAIEKTDKVLEKYPNSSWYDDALFVNGVSHYYLEDYTRAERRFRELLAQFPESKYAKETRIYLAKTKLKLGEIAEAMTLFERLFEESEEKSVKGEAAMALGEYYYENKDYENSREYFSSIIDSLGEDSDKLIAQMYIADGYYSRFKYRDALKSYLQILDMNPGLDEKYRAIFRSGECSYFLNDVEDGMGYFDELANDPAYFDSLGQVKLQLALGYELDGDLEFAEEVYQEVAVESSDKPAGATANYNLGLIYQFDYEDYKEAKGYYDKAKNRYADKEIYNDALQRSTDIGKLESYKEKHILDTSATQAEIDSAAVVQYLLGELYLFQMEKPDSAYNEFRYLVDNFSESYYAPKAMIAMALLKRDYHDDTLGYDSTLREILRKYARSDFAPEAINLLGLAGTKADTGYARYYYHKAEDFALEQENIDSARYYFQFVADSFPHSKLNVQAKYASIWVEEQYASPGDSSLYYAYVDFVDSFPDTDYGKEADMKLILQEGRQVPQHAVDKDIELADVIEDLPDDVADTAVTSSAIEDRPIIPEEKYFTDPDGNIIRETKEAPIRVDKEFRYPPTAYTTNFEGVLYVQVRIDAFGEVVDLRLMNPSPSQELNMEVEEVVSVSHFDTGWMEPEEYNTWFVYKYTVTLPIGIR